MIGQIIPNDTTRFVLKIGSGQTFSCFSFSFCTFAGNGNVGQEGIGEAYQMQVCNTTARYKLKDDPRVTRVGKILRRFSLDELPQVFNVLKREMSLVGPRMISPAEMDKYGQWSINLLTVHPGITGLWQVSGRSDVSYEDRVRMDMHYIRNWSLWLDLQLLLRTIPAVLRSKGAY